VDEMLKFSKMFDHTLLKDHTLHDTSIVLPHKFAWAPYCYS